MTENHIQFLKNSHMETAPETKKTFLNVLRHSKRAHKCRVNSIQHAWLQDPQREVADVVVVVYAT